MKKILLTAAIAMACLSANAQVGPQTSDNITLNATINVPDIIILTRMDQTPLVSNILNSNDLSWGEAMTLGTFFRFKVQSNRFWKLETSIGNFNWSANGVDWTSVDVNNVMNESDFSYEVGNPALDGSAAFQPTVGTYSAGAGMSFANYQFPTPTDYGAWRVYAPGANPVFTSAPYGEDQEFSMNFLCHPEWNHTGGQYTADITLTATQL